MSIRCRYRSLAVPRIPPACRKRSGPPSFNWSKLTPEANISSYTSEVSRSLNSISHFHINSSEDTMVPLLISCITHRYLWSLHVNSKRRPNWPASLAHNLSKALYKVWVQNGKQADPSNEFKIRYKEAKRNFRKEFDVTGSKRTIHFFFLLIHPTRTFLIQSGPSLDSAIYLLTLFSFKVVLTLETP